MPLSCKHGNIWPVKSLDLVTKRRSLYQTHLFLFNNLPLNKCGMSSTSSALCLSQLRDLSADTEARSLLLLLPRLLPFSIPALSPLLCTCSSPPALLIILRLRAALRPRQVMLPGGARSALHRSREHRRGLFSSIGKSARSGRIWGFKGNFTTEWAGGRKDDEEAQRSHQRAVKDLKQEGEEERGLRGSRT